MSIKDKIPPSPKRVQICTGNKINARITSKTLYNLAKYKEADSEAITTRLKELNREWDTERVLESNAAAIIFISSILGLIFSIYWFILTGFISFFLLIHALIGWCPPLPIIRRLGVRTPEEISEEKMVLRYMRGDFKEIISDPKEILSLLRKGY